MLYYDKIAEDPKKVKAKRMILKSPNQQLDMWFTMRANKLMVVLGNNLINPEQRKCHNYSREFAKLLYESMLLQMKNFSRAFTNKCRAEAQVLVMLNSCVSHRRDVNNSGGRSPRALYIIKIKCRNFNSKHQM